MITRTLAVGALVAVFAAVPGAQPAQPAPQSPIFTIQSDDFWLNLHHFLYVLGRAQLGTPDATRAAVVQAPREGDEGRARLTEGEQKTWAAAVMEYAAGFSRKDLLFDDPLPATTLAIAAAGDAPSLANVAVDPQTRSVLEREAPVYRKAWWPAHRAANRAWQSSMESLLEQHGATLVAFATRAYELPWPSGGHIVHASSYANWGGSYSTSRGLIVMSTRDRSMQGLNGLELLFHEAMHQWDAAVLTTLQAQARSVNLSVPRDLTHAMIFFTSGYAVQQIAPGHVPTADALDVWSQRLSGSPLTAQRLKPALEEIWRPHLDGRTGRDAALAALVARTAAR